MNCRDAQFYLRLRRHTADELGPEVTADLDRHLAGCPDCAAEGLVQAGFDTAVAGAMRAVEIPAGLRNRLVGNLSVRRGAEVRRKAVRSVALAASLLLTVGLAFGAFSASRPRLDTDALVVETDNHIQYPEGALAAQTLPLPFDLNLLVLPDAKAKVQNRDVPVVVFRERNGPGFAKVFAFSRGGAFDLRGVQDAQASHCRAAVIDDPARFPAVVYVVVHTGHSLDPFLRASNQPLAALR